jgi:TolA-binding protein
MNLKSKILAAGLAAIIAGGGIFAANMNTAQAQPAESADVAQLEAQVLQLQQQIAQISALIVQLKSQETCGNGICRFGETATSCPADCNTTTASCAAEGEDVSANKPCCSGLTALNSCTKGSCSYSCRRNAQLAAMVFAAKTKQTRIAPKIASTKK